MANVDLKIDTNSLPREHVSNGFAIVGPYGNIWANMLFDDPEAAVRYLDNYWNRSGGWKPDQWKLVSATQTIVRVEGMPEVNLSSVSANGRSGS